MADAETLMRIVIELRQPRLIRLLDDAQFFGNAAISLNDSWSRRAAKAAFGAVPQLRVK